MGKKTIWHTPDEMKPVDNTDVVVLGPMGFDGFRFYIHEDRQGRYPYENWIKWTYLDDIINSLDATSKALDMAIDALKQIQWFCYAPTMGERAGRMQQCADRTLNEISEIMKVDNANSKS